MTRDPFHLGLSNGGIAYTKNFNKLQILVDGVQLESKHVLNVYLSSVSDKKPRVEMMLVDDQNQVVTEYCNTTKRDKPVTYDVPGDIDVQGVPSHCGCWTNRKIKEWWRRINSTAGSW